MISGLFLIDTFWLGIYAMVVLIAPIGLFLAAQTLLYLLDRILVKHKLSPLDIIVFVILIGLPIYSAILANESFDQKILKGLITSVKKNLVLLLFFGIQLLIRSRRLSIPRYYLFMQGLCWAMLGIYLFMAYTMDPRALLSTGLVGFNPSKGGYTFRFKTTYIEIGLIFYFVRFLKEKKLIYVVCWAAFVSYLLFVAKGRITIFSVSLSMLFALATNVKFLEGLKRLLTLAIAMGFIVGIVYVVKPEYLNVLRDFFVVFVKAILGFETGEKSADSRWIQIATVMDYWQKHPGSIIFGIGKLSRELTDRHFSHLYMADIGIVGALFTYGIVGTTLFYMLFGYCVWLVTKIKLLKDDLYYKVTITIIMTQFIASFFAGGFIWMTIDLLGFMIILYQFTIFEKEERIRLRMENTS